MKAEVWKLSWLSGVALILATVPASPNVPAHQATAPQDRFAELQRTVDELAAQHKVRIVLDPTLKVLTKFANPPTGASLTETLDQIASSLGTAAWRNVYLPRESWRGASPEKIAALARAHAKWKLGNFASDGSEKDRPSIMLGVYADRSFISQLVQSEGVWERGYVLYTTNGLADGRTTRERLDDICKQQIALMQTVPPEQLPNPMLFTARAIGQLGKNAEPYMQRMLEAGTQVYEDTPPDQRKEIIGHGMQVMQRFGSSERPQSPNATPPGKSLKSIVAELERLHNVRIILDPSIFSRVLQVKAAGMTLPQALDALSAELPGTKWRRIYYPLGEDRNEPSRTWFISVARASANWGNQSIVTQNRSDPQAGLWHTFEAGSDEFQAALKSNGLNKSSTYVLFSTSPHDGSRALSQLFEDLLRQQTEMLIALPTDQLKDALKQDLQIYSDLSAADRWKALALPSMAGMMAVWFPIAAKPP